MVTQEEITQYITDAQLTYLGPIHWIDIQEKWIKGRPTTGFTLTVQFLSGCQIKCSVTQWKKHLKKLNEENCNKAINRAWDQDDVPLIASSSHGIRI